MYYTINDDCFDFILLNDLQYLIFRNCRIKSKNIILENTIYDGIGTNIDTLLMDNINDII